MDVRSTGDPLVAITKDEHDNIGVPVKKVGNYGWNTSDWERLTSTNGKLDVNASIDTSTIATSANQTNGNQQIQGNVDASQTDSGNPVKVGGKYNATKPTYTDGQRGNLQLGTRGALNVQITGPDSSNVIGVPSVGADGSSNSVIGMRTYDYPFVFNGTTWDRMRGDTTKGIWVQSKEGFSKDDNITITKTVVGSVTTFVKTNGSKTQTITINKTTGVTTKNWS